MSLVKHIELCSRFRNRTQWPNPFNFSIASINTQNTYIDDPVCLSAPVLEFKPLPASTAIALDSVESGWNFCVGHFRAAVNAYRGARVMGRPILESTPLDRGMAFRLNDAATPFDAAAIRTRTDMSAGLMHLPGASPLDGTYKHWVLVNEALGTRVQIDDYLDHVACFKPQPNWTIDHRYTVRKTHDVMRRRMTSQDGSVVGLNFPLPNASVDSFVRVISTGDMARVLTVAEDRRLLRVNPPLPNWTQEPCEILTITGDNAHAFNFTDHGRAYMMELVGVDLPNIRLRDTTNLFDVGQLRVELSVNGHHVKASTYSSNDPGIAKCSFVIAVPRGDPTAPFMRCDARGGPAIETNMTDLSEMTVVVRDSHGDILVPAVPDHQSPAPPNPETQLRLSLKLIAT